MESELLYYFWDDWGYGDISNGDGLYTWEETFTVSNSIESNLSATGAVSSFLGFSVTWSDEETVSYSFNIPPGERYIFKLRQRYAYYRVTEELHVDTGAMIIPQGETRYCYVLEYVRSEYDHEKYFEENEPYPSLWLT